MDVVDERSSLSDLALGATVGDIFMGRLVCLVRPSGFSVPAPLAGHVCSCRLSV